MMTKPDAVRYMRSLRSKPKQDYARKWIDHVFEGAQFPERPSGLSVMGAQAVRMTIGDAS